METWRVKCQDCGAVFTEVYPDGLDGDESYSFHEDPKPCRCESQYDLMYRVYGVGSERKSEHGHLWGNWAPATDQFNSLEPDDEGRIYPYIRECQIVGCASRQYAQDLEPVGTIKES